MTDIKEPINTTSDGTFLSVVCEKPPKKCCWPKVGGGAVALPAPPGITPLYYTINRSSQWHNNLDYHLGEGLKPDTIFFPFSLPDFYISISFYIPHYLLIFLVIVII